MKTGIYKIVNTINQKFYIGSACHFYNRKSKHLQLLRKNSHNNRHLQHAYNKDGEENFKFQLIEECDKAVLPIREQYYIDSLKPHYNICTVVEGRWGLTHLSVTKDKISKAIEEWHKQGGLSEESKQKIANTLKGRKQSEATIKKRSESMKKTLALKKQNGL